MAKGIVFNISRFCTDDGPGIRTTVFLKGCPLRCIWCHNPESQKSVFETANDGTVYGEKVTTEYVINEILKDKVFYDKSGGGVTVSGGEPLLQPEFTSEIFKKSKEAGVSTALETCGYADGDTFLKCIENVDFVLFDIKAVSNENHKKWTGASNEQILNNLYSLDKLQKQYILRLPIIPSLNDDDKHFKDVAQLYKSLKNCKGFEIMPYHSLGNYKYEALGREYALLDLADASKEQKMLWTEKLEYFIKQKTNH